MILEFIALIVLLFSILPERMNELNSDMLDRFISSNFWIVNSVFLSERKVVSFFVYIDPLSTTSSN
jgi:hypothetical protein